VTTLLLHGLGADRRQPLDLFGPVLDPAERVVAVDVRAHGASDLIGSPGDFAIDRLATEVAAFVRATDPSAGSAGGGAAPGRVDASGRAGDAAPFTVIGISMGAALALRIAMLGLLPVERAVFVRPSFDDRSLPPNLRIFPVIGQLLHDAGPGGAAQFRESSHYRRFEQTTPVGARALLGQFTAPRAAERAVRLVEVPRNRAFANDAELAQLGARGIRSLVVAAPRDPVHPLELGERWAGALGATLERLPARDDGQAAQTAALRGAVAGWLADR
jgi:pimeloyl-ACP methyl ester carboxylesterase